MPIEGPSGGETVLTLVSTRIFPGDGDPFPGFVQMRGEKILTLGRGLPENPGNIVDAGDNIVVPGLIDLHVHGSGGFSASSGDVAALEGMAKFLASNGVTAFQPTAGAAPVSEIESAIRAVKEFTQASPRGMARSLGLHLEGPFLNRGRPGAMPIEHLLDPDLSLMARWVAMGEGTINHVTLAPELPHAPDLIRYLAGLSVTVSMGHTSATYDEAVEGFQAGVTVSNHTFNAMRGFHHREPGALGAALTQKGIFCELIADGIHVHPAAISLLVASQGRDSVYLVTDAMPAAGLPPGEYDFLGKRVKVDARGAVTLPDGTLAGSAALLRQCLRNMVESVGVPLADALRMATVNPAKAARVLDRKGSLAPGKDADIVVLTSDYQVLWCWAEGRLVL